MVSPECRTSHHKTRLHDEAYAAFMRMGSTDSRTHDLGGTMYTFDYAEGAFRPDSLGETATSLLLEHFVRSWRRLVGALRASSMCC